LPDNIKHCLTSSIPGSGQQVKSPISSHHMLYKHSHYLCLSDLPSCISCHEDHCFTIKVVFSKQKSLPGYNLPALMSVCLSVCLAVTHTHHLIRQTHTHTHTHTAPHTHLSSVAPAVVFISTERTS